MINKIMPNALDPTYSLVHRDKNLNGDIIITLFFIIVVLLYIWRDKHRPGPSFYLWIILLTLYVSILYIDTSRYNEINN